MAYYITFKLIKTRNKGLEKFERALKDILTEYDNLGKELEKLRNEGKNKEIIIL